MRVIIAIGSGAPCVDPNDPLDLHEPRYASDGSGQRLVGLLAGKEPRGREDVAASTVSKCATVAGQQVAHPVAFQAVPDDHREPSGDRKHQHRRAIQRAASTPGMLDYSVPGNDARVPPLNGVDDPPVGSG